MDFSWWRSPRIINVVVDNDSWVLPYASELVSRAIKLGDSAYLVRNYSDVKEGAVAFYLGCVRITPPDILRRNRKNLVVHESDLPKGRGFSPLTWSILGGADKIPICLLEAADEVDSGPIIYKYMVQYEGHELIEELRAPIGNTYIDACLRYLQEATPPLGKSQVGEASYLPRRSPKDSILDPDKSLREQFNLLRVVDNEKYPAFFVLNGEEYVLKVEKRKT